MALRTTAASVSQALRCLAAVTLLGLAAWGCATAKTVKRTVVLMPDKNANYGRPFYVLLRAVDEKQFLTDNYNAVAKMVYPNSEDPSVLKAVLVWPATPRKVQVEVAKDKAIGVYCIFTRPGNPWKLLLAPPMKSEQQAVLGKNTIVIRSRGNDD